jgi:DNA sulfur modification protein DndC
MLMNRRTDTCYVVDLGQLYRDTGGIPWVVGLSGGKDSTALTMLLLETIEMLPPPIRNKKKVFVTCVNTLVEAPPVIEHVHSFIGELKNYVRDRELPVEVVELVPDVSQTFWVNLIGRGYPTPIRDFRWCTDRMKVRPGMEFLKQNPEIFGEPPIVHFLLGTRFDESISRQRTMQTHTKLGTDIHNHGIIPTAGVIRPIENWTTDDVWDYLLRDEWGAGGLNPFQNINQKLAIMYRDAASGECPVIHDPTKQTCAGSRFGCWTCTVVEVDSSLREMIDTGGSRYDSEKLTLLADFRDRLKEERNITKNRVQGRNRRGTILVQRDGSIGVGSYTIEYRKELLKRLQKLEEDFGEPLISQPEKDLIPIIWAEEQANLAILMQKRLEKGGSP